LNKYYAIWGIGITYLNQTVGFGTVVDLVETGIFLRNESAPPMPNDISVSSTPISQATFSKDAYTKWPYFLQFSSYVVPTGTQYQVTVDARSVLICGCIMLGGLSFQGYRLRSKSLAMHQCSSCRYDLRGSLQSDKCPECGTVIPAEIKALGGTGVSL
jgi:hypothetical protein